MKNRKQKKLQSRDGIKIHHFEHGKSEKVYKLKINLYN